jgi:hypothetical protein
MIALGRLHCVRYKSPSARKHSASVVLKALINEKLPINKEEVGTYAVRKNTQFKNRTTTNASTTSAKE